MIFLNWLLALGALAFTVPLAIHLLFRNRFETLDWGAMRFLEAVVRVNRRRMQLRNLLLLIIRCAIPILLAFCLARPVITGWQTLPGDEPLSLLLALDTSYSLASKLDNSGNADAATQSQGNRRVDRLISTAEEIVAALPRGSDVTLVTSATAGRDETADVFSGDAQKVLSSLQSLDVSGRPLSIEALLSESLRKVTSLSTERRQIVLLTDDAASDLTQTQLDSLASIGERKAAIKPEVRLAWIDAWPNDATAASAQLPNRRVAKLESAQSASVPGQPVVWTVELRDDNDAEGTLPEATIEVLVDGAAIETFPVKFRDGIAVLSFESTFETAGRHVVEVALPGGDSFAPDDRLRADFAVLPPIDVWLVDGTVSDRPLQSDTDFLAVALSPFSLAGEKAVDLFRTSKVSARELHSQKDELPRVVVLADVGALRSEVSTWLSDFVENKGGTLIMFAGPATDDTVYDKQLLGSDGRSILPMTWGDVRELDASGSGAKIDESQMTYPPLASFSRDAKGTLESVGVTAYRAMKPRPKVEADEAQKPEAAVTPETQAEADKDAKKSDVNVVMRLANGDPLMVVSDVGKGRVLQVATTANDRWTSLPRRLAFVPLVQRLMMHLATGENRVVTPSAGEPIVIDLPKTMETSGDVAGAKKPDDKQTDGAELTWTVTTPAGKTMPAASDKEKVRFGETDLVGIYRFESSDGQVVYSAINVPEAELKRTPSDSAVRDDAAKRVGATRYATLEAYSSDDSTRRFGRGIWRYMLLALLAAMILEPVIQQRGARVTS
jgi:hypothetical protein